MTPLRVTRARHTARAWAEVGGPSGHLRPPKAPVTPTQDAGVCEGALAGVEAVGAQVGRHHLLDQRLQAQVVLGHAAGLVHALREGGVEGHPQQAWPLTPGSAHSPPTPCPPPSPLSCGLRLCPALSPSALSWQPWCPGEKDPVAVCRWASCSPPLGGSPSRLPGSSGCPAGASSLPRPDLTPRPWSAAGGKGCPVGQAWSTSKARPLNSCPPPRCPPEGSQPAPSRPLLGSPPPVSSEPKPEDEAAHRTAWGLLIRGKLSVPRTPAGAGTQLACSAF